NNLDWKSVSIFASTSRSIRECLNHLPAVNAYRTLVACLEVDLTFVSGTTVDYDWRCRLTLGMLKALRDFQERRFTEQCERERKDEKAANDGHWEDLFSRFERSGDDGPCDYISERVVAIPSSRESLLLGVFACALYYGEASQHALDLQVVAALPEAKESRILLRQQGISEETFFQWITACAGPRFEDYIRPTKSLWTEIPPLKEYQKFTRLEELFILDPLSDETLQAFQSLRKLPVSCSRLVFSMRKPLRRQIYHFRAKPYLEQFDDHYRRLCEGDDWAKSLAEERAPTVDVAAWVTENVRFTKCTFPSEFPEGFRDHAERKLKFVLR
ncbi:hypothetical protein HKX48_004932, partial [Thoreauomyces humboldtii]